MRRNWRKVVLLIAGLLLLPLACSRTELVSTAPPPTMSPSPSPEDTPQPVVYQGTTDQEGKAIIADSQGSEQAIVQVEDEDSRLPVSGIEIYFMQRGSRYLAISIDPEGRYLTSWSQGSVEESNSSSSSLTTVASFFPSRPAYAQTVPQILLLPKMVSNFTFR